MSRRKPEPLAVRPIYRSAVIGGVLYERLPARPYCDCLNVARGFVKREDGCWVRPCCMRRTKTVWDKTLAETGDGDTPPRMDPEEAAALRAASFARINALKERVSIERQIERLVDGDGSDPDYDPDFAALIDYME